MTNPWTPPRQSCRATNAEVRDFYRDQSDAPGKGPIRTVSLTLASYYNAEHGCAYPGSRGLAETCRIGQDTALKAVKALETAGEWCIVSVPYGKGRRQVYVPTMKVGTWPEDVRADKLKTLQQANAEKARAAKDAADALRATESVEVLGGTASVEPATDSVPPSPTCSVGPSPTRSVGPGEACRGTCNQAGNCSGCAVAGRHPDWDVDPFAPAETPAPAQSQASPPKTEAVAPAPSPTPPAVEPATGRGKGKADDAHQAAQSAFKAFYDARIKGTGEDVAFIGVVLILARMVRNGLDPARLPAVIEKTYGYGYGFSADQLSKAKRELDGRRPQSGASKGEGAVGSWDIPTTTDDFTPDDLGATR